MKLHKRILNQNWAQAFVTWLAATYLRFVRFSGRWETRGWDHIQTLLDDGKPVTRFSFEEIELPQMPGPCYVRVVGRQYCSNVVQARL